MQYCPLLIVALLIALAGVLIWGCWPTLRDDWEIRAEKRARRQRLRARTPGDGGDDD